MSFYIFNLWKIFFNISFDDIISSCTEKEFADFGIEDLNESVFAIKISDEKKAVFNNILTNLQSIYGEKVEILNENKLISLEINGRNFKIDLIEQRKPKK